MRKIKLMKVLVLLFTVLVLSNCEENGEIQFIVIDDFPTSVSVNGLANESTFTISDSTNISDLLDGASSFVEADVESVSLLLENYSGTSISGSLSVLAGSVPLMNQPVSLNSTTPLVVPIPEGSSNILSLISGGNFPITVIGTSADLLGDDNFNIKLVFKIKATVE